LGRRPYSIPPESFSESVDVGALVEGASLSDFVAFASAFFVFFAFLTFLAFLAFFAFLTFFAFFTGFDADSAVSVEPPA